VQLLKNRALLIQFFNFGEKISADFKLLRFYNNLGAEYDDFSYLRRELNDYTNSIGWCLCFVYICTYIRWKFIISIQKKSMW